MTHPNNTADGRDSMAPAGISRRSVAKAAAWSVPVLALAVATPLASASTTDINVGDFRIDGTCGASGAGKIGTGFDVTAGAVDLPIGTVIKIQRTSGTVNLDNFTWTGNPGDSVVNTPSVTITLSTAIPANTTLSWANPNDVTQAFAGSGTITLPSGYVGGGGSKASGTLDDSNSEACTAS